MSTEDEQSRWLREQLDRELGGLTSRPQALRNVLAAGAPRPRWWRTASGAPSWLLAAASVLVVALAVPLLASTVFSRNASAARLASGPATTSATPPEPSQSCPAGVLCGSLRAAPPRATPTHPPTHLPSRAPTHPPSAPATPVPTAPAGCPQTTPVPGRTSVPVDMNGDGRPDDVYAVGGTLQVGLSGGGTVSAPLNTASPYVFVLPVESDATPGAELLVITRAGIGTDGSLGMLATMWNVRGCTLAPVTNSQGSPYAFEVGGSQSGTRRSGVACDGGAPVGVTSVRDAKGGWTVTRTPVSSAGGKAVNGIPTTTTVPDGDPAALQDATCGSASPQSLQ